MPRLLSLALLAAVAPTAPAAPKTENVLFVMFDGVRWQELFTGADEELMNKDRGGVADIVATGKRFWRDTPEARRAALFPFLWGTVAKDGQLFGDHRAGCVGRVTNGHNFSYPGYNEILCGFPDPKVASNAKIPNRNVTVLEWLHRKPEFAGKVAAFTSWDVFPSIINEKRSGIPVNGGLVPLVGVADTAEVRLLNRLVAEAPLAGEDVRPDALTYHAARIHLAEKKPRVLFLSFDETDAQAHAGRYDRVLGSGHKADALVRDLWETVQAMPEYRGKTTLVVTTDHGRGGAPVEWKNHSAKIKGAEYWWAGVLGPDTPALGVRKDTGPVTQDQVAATVAAALGHDYRAAVPQAGKPLPGAVGGK